MHKIKQLLDATMFNKLPLPSLQSVFLSLSLSIYHEWTLNSPHFFRNFQTPIFVAKQGFPFPIARGHGGGGTLGTSEKQPIWPPLAGAKTEMAEVGMNPLPSGYEYEFISTVLDDHHCLICHLPLREPVQTRCGHRFCKKCLDEAIRRYAFELRLYVILHC